MISRIVSAAISLALLTAAALPQNGPVPQTRPDVEGAEPAPATQENPQTPPIPQPKPSEDQADQPQQSEQQQSPPAPMQGPPRPPLTIASESDEDHQSCEADLRAMGATFKDIPRIDDGDGCGIDKPISLSEALPGIKVKPEGAMRCQTALALAHWMKQSVIPAAETALPDSGRITTINQASTYVCKLRNGATTGKISEHARGNAIDVASFSFEKGEPVAVEPRREDPTLTGAFQRTVSAAGCLYFATVLDPESDAAHEHHFHLDVMERHGGFRYCH